MDGRQERRVKNSNLRAYLLEGKGHYASLSDTLTWWPQAPSGDPDPTGLWGREEGQPARWPWHCLPMPDWAGPAGGSRWLLPPQEKGTSLPRHPTCPVGSLWTSRPRTSRHRVGAGWKAAPSTRGALGFTEWKSSFGFSLRTISPPKH